MSASIKFDLAGFQRGLRAKLAATKRAEAEVLNQAAKNVCLRAIAYTPKADPAAIERELTKGGLAFRLLQSRSFQGRLPKSLRGFTRGTHSRKQLNDAVRKLVTLRRRSAGYIKAGWIKAAQEFGGAARGRVSEKSLAGRGYGVRATQGNLKAIGVNLARGAGTVGADALQKALNYVGKDMLSYAEKKIAGVWK